MNAKKAVLLLNLGTPDSPKTSDVRKYLKQFLLDPRVIDIPWLFRQLLVRCIIAPFRAPKSAKSYVAIWDKVKGSPLLSYSKEAAELLQNELGNEYEVFLAMRYQNPSIESVLEKILPKNFNEIIVFPMFPHYASASTGSALEEFMRVLSKSQHIPSIRTISDYFQHPMFINAILEQTKQFDLNSYDHILFSYHGLPQSQLKKLNNGHCLQKTDCCQNLCNSNRYCYSAQCFATTSQLAKALNLPSEKYTTCFQSRLGSDPWVQPYTIKTLEQLAKEGKKRILCFSPAFTADCLETIFEIQVEYHDEFQEMGGELVHLVPSLNTHQSWISCMASLIKN